MRVIKIVICLIGFSLNTFAQQWYNLGNGVTNTFGNANVSSITSYQNKITIGGYFKKSNNTILNGVAQWNGSQWVSLGIGVWDVDSPDSSGNGGGLATYHNQLYSGGIFSGAGGIQINNSTHKANNIAKWDGTDWYPLTQPGDGLTNSCSALCVYNDNLYLGGFFSNALDSSGAHTTRGIAKWNDTVISSVGQFYGNYPNFSYFTPIDFTLYNNKLIAGGYFTTIDTLPYGSYNFVAAWNDTAWFPLSTGLNGPVFALTVFNGELYAGGIFTATGDGTPASRIAKWNGTQWLPVGEGLNDTVNVLYVDTLQNKLYAGGYFTQTGLGQPAKHLAEWNGTNWVEVGGGTNNVVTCLFAKDSNLYVGGWFTQAGSIAANLIARWGKSSVGINELKKRDRKIKLFPNPSNGSFQLNYNLNEGEQGELKIMDIAGRLISKYNLNVSENELHVNQNTLSNGVYLYQVIINNTIITSDKLTIINQ